MSKTVNNFHRLANTSSGLRSAMISYFEVLISELDTTGFFYNDYSSGQIRPLKVSDIAVDPIVVTEERLPEQFNLQEKEGRAFEIARSKKCLAEVLTEAYERPVANERNCREKWSRTIRKGRLRLAVKGEPGGGKTFITRYTAIKIARESISRLQSFVVDLADIQIPVWVTADQLALSYRESRQTAVDLLLRIIRKGHDDIRLSQTFYEWVSVQINSVGHEERPRFTIFIDALDEIRATNEEYFQRAVQRLDQFAGSVIVTCRKTRWESQQRLLSSWRKIRIVELAPFNGQQQREMVNRFFSGNPELRDSLRKITECNYALRTSLASPLMLSFICLLHVTRSLGQEDSYIELYRKVLEKLFSGEFAPPERKPFWTKNQDDGISIAGKTEMLTALFDEISWQLFQENQDSKEFSLREWNQAFVRGIKQVKKLYPQIHKIEGLGNFQTELLNTRLLLYTRREKGVEKWCYLHRTFLEFAAARALANREISSAIVEARRRFWDAKSLEFLTFFAGSLSDVHPLIVALREEQELWTNEIFGWLTFVEARLLGAVNLNANESKRICDKTIYGLTEISRWWGLPISIKEGSDIPVDTNSYAGFPLLAISSLNQNHRCRMYILSTLFSPIIKLMQTGDESALRCSQAKALGKLGVDSPDVINALLQTFEEQVGEFADDSLSTSAALALGDIGNDSNEVITVLTKALKDYTTSSSRRECSAKVLGKLGNSSPEVIAALTFSLTNDEAVCNYAAGALGDLGDDSPAVIGALTEFLLDDGVKWVNLKSDGQRWWKLESASRALRKLGFDSPEIISALIELLQDRAGNESENLAPRALGELRISSPEVIAALLRYLKYGNSLDVRKSAAEALGKLKSAETKVIEALIEYLQTTDDKYDHPMGRVSAINALSKLGIHSRNVITALEHFLLNDVSLVVRGTAALALGKLFKDIPEQIAPLLVSLLNTEDEKIRPYAAKALGSLGHSSPEVIATIVKALNNSTNAISRQYLYNPLGDGDKYESGYIYDGTHPLIIITCTEALGKLGNASLEVIDALIYSMKFGTADDGAEALREICIRNRGQLNYSDVIRIVKQIISRLDKNNHILDPGLSRPLFEIWQANWTNENKLILTWDMLEKDSEDSRI